MKILTLLLVASLSLSACGTKEESNTAAQENQKISLKEAEGKIASTGVIVHSDNSISCLSSYREVCQQQLSALKQYVQAMTSELGDISSMSAENKKRFESAARCIDRLTDYLRGGPWCNK